MFGLFGKKRRKRFLEQILDVPSVIVDALAKNAGAPLTHSQLVKATGMSSPDIILAMVILVKAGAVRELLVANAKGFDDSHAYALTDEAVRYLRSRTE